MHGVECEGMMLTVDRGGDRDRARRARVRVAQVEGERLDSVWSNAWKTRCQCAHACMHAVSGGHISTHE